MMQWGHAEDPSSLTIGSFGGFEHPHLNDHGQRLCKENAPHHEEWPKAVGQQGDCGESSTHREGTCVSHKDASWMAVKHQKPEPCASHRHAKASEGWVAMVAAQHQLKR
jgi:hypothetical protein